MSDGLVLFSIALVFVIVPGIIQFVWLCLFQSTWVKLLPLIVFTPIWLICVLGAYNIINIPPSETLMSGGFLAFHDDSVIAVIGVPVLIGIALAWLIHLLILRRKK